MPRKGNFKPVRSFNKYALGLAIWPKITTTGRKPPVMSVHIS
jgi:hypothetical protein